MTLWVFFIAIWLLRGVVGRSLLWFLLLCAALATLFGAPPS